METNTIPSTSHPSEASTRIELAARGLIASLLAISAFVHYILIGQHMNESKWAGAAFVAMTVLLVAAAVSIVFRPRTIIYAAVIAVLATMLCAYFTARATTLWPMNGVETFDAKGLLTQGDEIVIIAVSTWLLLRARRKQKQFAK
jgi:hypothetical protein